MHGWSDWLNLVGGLLNLIGIVCALWGVVLLKKELFPPGYTPLGRLARRVKRLFRKPKPNIGVAAVMLPMTTISGRGRQGLLEPETGAPQSAWNEHFRALLGDLQRQIDGEAALNRNEILRVERLRHEEESATRLQMQASDDRVLHAVAGHNGQGLDLAWWGLSAAVLGTFLQFVAGLISKTPPA